MKSMSADPRTSVPSRVLPQGMIKRRPKRSLINILREAGKFSPAQRGPAHGQRYRIVRMTKQSVSNDMATKRIEKDSKVKLKSKTIPLMFIFAQKVKYVKIDINIDLPGGVQIRCDTGLSLPLFSFNVLYQISRK